MDLRVQELVSSMTLEEKIGQLLHIGIGLGYLEDETGWPNEEMRTAITDLKPGAIRVYGTHDHGPHFMAEYTNTLQEWATEAGAGLPLLISCDCEYGTTDVVKHGVEGYPALLGRTATGSTDLAQSVSAAIARDMQSVGLNMVHQPDVDVNTNPNNPVIGVRAAGYNVEDVTKYTEAQLRGAQTEEQATVAKHFPGHGDTSQDSHHDLPAVTYGRETLEDVHLRPFKTAIDAGVDAIMTSHIVVECLDDERPATLSSEVLTGLLREEMGFDGVVITDAMSMDAVAENYGVANAAVEAVKAGVDLVLTGFVPLADLIETRDALLDAVKFGEITERRITASVARILAIKDRYDVANNQYVDPLDAVAVTGSNDHSEIARESYEASFTLLGTDAPLPIADNATVLATGVKEVRALEPSLDDAVGDVVSYQLPTVFNRPDESVNWGGDGRTPTGTADIAEYIEVASSSAEDVDVAIVTTYTDTYFPEPQRQFVQALADEMPVVVVSLGLPTEYGHLSDNVAYIATYAQDRLGMPEPLPEAGCEALCSFLKSEQQVAESLPFR